MHPNEMKNRALTAAAAAEAEGYYATAEALMQIAIACAEEAALIASATRCSGSPAKIGTSCAGASPSIFTH
jgi:hypothetical protein